MVEFDGAAWMDGLTEDNSDCSTFTSPRIPVILGSGSAITVPLPCITEIQGHFGGSSFAFTFSGTITDADPGNGYMRFNNATVASVTQIYVSDADYGGSDILGWLDSLSAGGRLRVFSITDPTDWVEFTINSVTSATGYRKLNVTYVDNSGTLINDLGDTVISFTGGSVGAGVPAGGTTDQILSKINGTDYNTQWVTSPYADKTKTVGTGYATTGTNNIDFSAVNDTFQSIAALTGAITFTTSNKAAGKSVTIRIINGATLRAFTFPGWTFVGAAAPANIAASKTGILTLTCFGTAESDVIAAWAVQP